MERGKTTGNRGSCVEARNSRHTVRLAGVVHYAFDNTTDTHTTVYRSTTEYREQLAALYYPWRWLHLGIDVVAHQFANGGSFISYGGGLGINF